MSGDIHVTEWGEGPAVVLIHGGTPQGGSFAFAPQQALAERWHLILPDRPGHGETPKMGHEDFESDSKSLAGLLNGGVHLVGASYGGIVALYMAAAAPEKVKSLTLLEAPAYFLDPSDPDISEMSHRGQESIQNPDPSKVILSFFDLVGIDVPLPDPVPDFLLGLADDLRAMRGPWEADVDPDALRAGGYPILALTSGNRPGFEAVAQAMVRVVGARHIVVDGTDHTFLSAGATVNSLLEELWQSAEGS
jgi:pimeloyl-ACP methyl ester carboxylesterase